MARKKSLDRLLSRIVDPVTEVRRDALDALNRFDWRSTRPTRRQRDQAFRAIVARLRGDRDEQVRIDSAYVLTFWFERRGMKALLEAAQDPRETVGVRAQTIEGLGSSLECRVAPDLRAEVLPFLSACTKDPAPEIRFWALYAIGVGKAKEARPIVKDLAASDHAMCPWWWRVSEEARDVLAAWDTGVWPKRERAPS